MPVPMPVPNAPYVPPNKDLSRYSGNNFNPVSRRRTRLDSRFPDSQWDCALKAVEEALAKICDDEMPGTFRRYCEPMIQQKLSIVESVLYKDSTFQMCQHTRMCPGDPFSFSQPSSFSA
eukprot:GILI01005430.1.p2 GENE.GILI01005430.1~~GILI01005430.1.p2  ORF type:complete len:138 (-),score=46.84 GILI01005430.1:175-531(-)